MREPCIIIIPAEGDSVETEQWYAEAVRKHYAAQHPRVLVLDCSEVNIWKLPTQLRWRLRQWVTEKNLQYCPIEVHAQGGLGAMIACELFSLRLVEVERSRCFFIGGAPCTAMTGIAKLFHCLLARLWLWSPFAYFADDPNPNHDPVIAKIKESSTREMRRNPRRYCDQLECIGHWKPSALRLPAATWFVPNGEAPWPKWRNNTYNDRRARRVWLRHGVPATMQPTRGFSFYSMMPADALFEVMDAVRTL